MYTCISLASQTLTLCEGSGQTRISYWYGFLPIWHVHNFYWQKAIQVASVAYAGLTRPSWHGVRVWLVKLVHMLYHVHACAYVGPLLH